MISRKNKKITKGGKLPKVNKKTKKDCINAVYKTNKTIEYCPLCMIKLIPTQFTIHLISLVMKTIWMINSILFEMINYCKYLTFE